MTLDIAIAHVCMHPSGATRHLWETVDSLTGLGYLVRSASKLAYICQTASGAAAESWKASSCLAHGHILIGRASCRCLRCCRPANTIWGRMSAGPQVRARLACSCQSMQSTA